MEGRDAHDRAIAVIQPSATLVFGIVFSLFLFFGGRMVVDGRMTLGEFVAFNTYIGYLTDRCFESPASYRYGSGIVSMGRIDYAVRQTGGKRQPGGHVA